MGRHVVVGSGAVGTATALALAGRGQDVVVATRRGSGPHALHVELARVDAADGAALAELAEGSAAIYNCVNPRYHRWEEDWPPMAAAFLAAAERSGARLVTVGNLYGYGPVGHAITEQDPLRPNGPKGAVRNQMWQEALAAHEAGRAKIAEARASDFYGPGLTDQGMFGERLVPRLLAGKAVSVLGDPDAPHSWSYVPDVAELLASLGTTPDESALGRPWHVPTAPPRSSRAMVAALAAAAGLERPPTVRRVPAAVLRAAGLFSVQLRELQETRYQFDRPFVIDSSAAEEAFGLEPTSVEEAAKATVVWWQDRLAEGGPGSAPGSE